LSDHRSFPTRRSSDLFLLAFTFFVEVVSASGPTAVYALIDKVTLEPNDDRPQRIVIYGVFSTAGNTYSEPQRGYLCFTLPTQNSELALREWSDLKSVAGTRQVVAFGRGWMAKVRVRKSSAEAGNDPDLYTLNFGVKKLNADEPHAKALLDYKGDRKSTRLNSSHGSISYAVFCLKKKERSVEEERQI